MAKLKYELNEDEKIVYKATSVRHGFWGLYTNTLVITNQCVILEKYGTFSNFKGIERYYYNEIKQVIKGKASNGEEQLEIYIGNKKEDFALQSGEELDLKVLITAINDQMSSDAEYYDFNYYQNILTETKDNNRIIELRAKAVEEKKDVPKTSGVELAGAVAKNVLKSGDLSVKGITKGIKKATRKGIKKGIFGGMVDELLDDLGVRDIQDEFIEIGNDFRQEFGMKTKMTYAEKKELVKLEKEQKKKEIEKEKKSILQNKIDEQKRKIDAKKHQISEEKKQIKISKMTVNEQLDALKKAKELLDDGILTKDEFNQKKEEIMNS